MDINEQSLATTHETISQISCLRLDGIRGGIHLNCSGMDSNYAPWECGVFKVHHESHVLEDMQGHGNAQLCI